MSEATTTTPPLTKLAIFRDVQPYAKLDDRGRARTVTALDENKQAIDALGDVLHRQGYGVLRERNPRAGRVYYRLNALWASPGEPPENPMSDPASRSAP